MFVLLLVFVLDRLEAIAARPALAHCSSIVTLGAPLTPIPPTSSPPASMGRPPGRTANRSIAIIPGLAVLAHSSIADVGDWNPAAAYAFCRATSTVTPVVLSPLASKISTPSRFNTETVTE